MSKSSKRKKILIFTGIGVVVLAVAAVAIFRKREVVITVQTEKVARRNLTELVRANGKIQPVVQVKISPEVSGEIIELPVKEGQMVQQGDLLVKIKPDNYIAARNQAEASYKASEAGRTTAQANLRKADAEYKRVQDLFRVKLISESAFDEVRASYDVARAQLSSSEHQVEMSKASLARAEEDLAKTTIVAPITGTISKLNSEKGERVVGTAMMAGSDVMTVADLNNMEARVDIGEMDVVLIAPGQNVRLEVDAFKDRKFSGTVTQIANSSRTASLGSSSSQEATKFEVRIKVNDKEAFRPGMSVTAEIETRSRSNVLTVPIASVTTRMPKEKPDKDKKEKDKGTAVAGKPDKTTNSAAVTATGSTNDTTRKDVAAVDCSTNGPAHQGTNTAKSDKKSKEPVKPIEVVFLMEKDHVKMTPVKIGISDDEYWEILEGLKEGQEIVSGGYRAISKDLEDGKKVRKGMVKPDKDNEPDRNKKES